MCLSGEHLGIQEKDNEIGDNNEKCSNRTKKSIIGLFFSIIIASSWVGAIHLLKICFELTEPQQQDFIDLKNNDTQSQTQLTLTNLTVSWLDPLFIYSIKIMLFMKESHHNNSTKLIFDAPFFVAWFWSLWNALYLPFYIMTHLCTCSKENSSIKKLIM